MSLIGFCVLCYLIYRMIVRTKNGGNGRPGTGRLPDVHTVPAKHREQRTTGQPNQHSVRQQNQPAKVRQSVKNPEEKGSTMAYLEEKARQDAAEHAREKWEETRRLNQNYGGLRVAQRLFEGDSVPGGQKCVVCGYCGAENLVPMMPREKYSCYFCREPLW